MKTIHVNSETLGLLFMANHPTSVPRCGPEIRGHFWPHTHQNMIYCINQHPRCPNSPCTVTNCPKRIQQFSHFGSKIWNRSNGRSRPQTNRNINKALKQSVTSGRMKPLSHGVCRNFKKPIPTRCPRRVERLSFLLRRNLTVGLAGILERRHSFSL